MPKPLEFGTLEIHVPDYLIPPTGSIIKQGYEFDLEYQIRPNGVTGSLSYPYSGNTTGGTLPFGQPVITGDTTISYIGIGSSRLDEKRKYGTGSGYDTSTFTYGNTLDNIGYTGYTFTYTGSNTNAILYYRDRADGFTEIAGSTTGFTQEEVFEQTLTRNEHFLGFIEEPRVYSDIFVDRGKQGVSEKNLRLTEIDNLGELSIYGNGFFKVRKQ
jgi:hypothetical protein